ncbi:U3 snoRNP-associated protein-like YAOH [Diplonema papillatum]|nr:U3 snoRNP-associated protein-like YAOH [Diplonema papillatum]|eukprot:gene15292-23369_t
MAKKIIVRKKKTAPKSAAPVLEAEDEEIDAAPAAPEPETADTAPGDAENDELAERLRQDALKAIGRSFQPIAPFVQAGEPLVIPTARGCPTAAVVTGDGLWAWYGDKNGNVFRRSLATDKEWSLVGRHKGKVLCLALTEMLTEVNTQVRGGRSTETVMSSKIPRMAASGSDDGVIKIWNLDDASEVHELLGHKGPVTGVSFRLGKTVLVSGGSDRTLKMWAAEDGVLLDTLYGHTGKITSVAAGWKEEALTTGDDCGVRLFKIDKGTSLAFTESQLVVECGAFLTDQRYLAGDAEGSLRLFDTLKRRPICKVATAHGVGFDGDGSGLERIMSQEEIQAGTGSLAPGQPQHPNWIMALAAVPYSDLVVSGGLGGSIHFWRVSGDNEVDFVANPEALTDNPLTSLHLLHTIPVDGIVNSLYLPRSAQCVIATVSREPRLGRWFTSNGSRNHILVIPLTTKQMPRSVPASLSVLPSSSTSKKPAGKKAGKKKMVRKLVKKRILHLK